MSSWRESDPEPAKPPKSAKPSRTVKPASSGKPPPTVPSNSEASEDWRGKLRSSKNRTPGLGGSAASKEWLASDATPAGYSKSTLRKWSVIGLLFFSFVAATSLLIQQLFFKMPKLPIYAICVGEYPLVPEFRENPFGNQQRQQVEAINPNYVMPYSRTSNGNDQLLGVLRSRDWLGSLELPRDLVKLGRPVTAYYVNCYARISQDSIALFHQSSTPFSSGDLESQTSIDLQTLLENLASAAGQHKDRYLWVILDLQLPPTVSALGDLGPPWRTAVELTLQRVKNENPDHPEWFDRLVVTIPADDGQNNWLAPEYSASFFGYHLFKLLDTPQEDASLVSRLLGRPVTLDEFQTSLNQQVRQDVASRRYAVQSPVWLPEENLQRFNSLGLVGGSQGTFQSPPTSDPVSRTQYIRELWKKFNAEILRDAYRWDPVGHAKVESQLLALEEIAVNQPDSFASASREVEQALGNLGNPTLAYGVSLIEDSMRVSYFCTPQHAEQLTGRLKVESMLNQGQPPPFWAPQTDSQSSPPSEEPRLSGNEKLRLVWGSFLRAAQGDLSTWSLTFQRDRLEKALAYADLNYESDQPPPIEIYLLQRLRDDVDWQRSGVDPIRAEACAKMIAAFEGLQSIAASPEPMLARWLLEPVRTVEAEFLLGCDWLLAGGFRESIEKFNLCMTELQKLRANFENVATGLASAQETLWMAPHALAWLLREYQFSEGIQEIEKDMAELGQAVQRSLVFYQQLSAANRNLSELSVDGPSMKNQMLTLRQKFNSYVESKTDYPSTSAASRSPLTFRRNRIALMCPLLTLEQRDRLHQNVAAYLSDVGGGSSAAAEFSLKEQRSLTDAIGAFLRPLNTPDTDQELRKLCEGLVKGDLRYQLLDLMSAVSAPLPSEDAALRGRLLEAEVRLRTLALAIGDAPSLDSKTDSQNAWPFSAASWRWKLSEAERSVWQVARLAEAGWGHGHIPASSDPSRFYFGLLGSRYLSQIPSISDAVTSERLQQIVRNGQKRLVDRATNLNSLLVRFGNERQAIGESETLQAPIVVTSPKWNAMAAAYLGTRAQRLPWHPRDPEDRLVAIPLDSQTGSNEKFKGFATSYWESSPPTGNLAIRGNYRSGPIEWRTESSPFIPMQLAKESRSDAEIYVDAAGDSPVFNVVILLDCSNSMKLQVNAMVETESNSGSNAQIPLFDQVTSNVKRVISELAKAHEQREADIQVCLIPFGIGHYRSLKSGYLKEFLSEQRVTAKPMPAGEWGHFYPSKTFVALNEDGQSQLERAIDELAGENKVDTPLYDAIHEACGRIQRKQNQDRSSVSQILVFTDGVHYVNERSPYDGLTSPAVVLQGVQANRARLDIFYYNHFKSWLKKDPQNKNEEFWQGIENRGVRELEELKSQSELIDFVKSSDAAELVRRSLETIPRTSVQVLPLQSTIRSPITVESNTTGFQARIPASLLPGSFEVTSTGTRGGAKQRIDLRGGERVELRLSARGSREFGFPPFDPEVSQSGWRAPTQGQRSGGGFVGNAWYFPDWSRPLSFVWMTRHQEHPKQFTSRPRLAVSMLSNIQNPDTQPFILADSFFEPGTHYPRLRFAAVPWSDHSQLTKAQLTLWIADELPPELRLENLQQEASGDIANLSHVEVSWKSSGGNLTVDVHYTEPPKLDQRLVILCPHAETASRKLFTERNDESYLFSWNDSPPSQALVLQLTTVGQLRSWVEKGLVTEFTIDQVDTVR